MIYPKTSCPDHLKPQLASALASIKAAMACANYEEHAYGLYICHQFDGKTAEGRCAASFIQTCLVSGKGGVFACMGSWLIENDHVYSSMNRGTNHRAEARYENSVRVAWLEYMLKEKEPC